MITQIHPLLQMSTHLQLFLMRNIFEILTGKKSYVGTNICSSGSNEGNPDKSERVLLHTLLGSLQKNHLDLNHDTELTISTISTMTVTNTATVTMTGPTSTIGGWQRSSQYSDIIVTITTIANLGIGHSF